MDATAANKIDWADVSGSVEAYWASCVSNCDVESADVA